MFGVVSVKDLVGITITRAVGSLRAHLTSSYLLGTTPYTWKGLDIELLLDLNVHDVDEEQSVHVQRRELLKALEINANWKSAPTRIRKQTRFTQFISFISCMMICSSLYPEIATLEYPIYRLRGLDLTDTLAVLSILTPRRLASGCTISVS